MTRVRVAVGAAATALVALAGSSAVAGPAAARPAPTADAGCDALLTSADTTGAADARNPALTASSPSGVYLWLDQAAWHLRLVGGAADSVLTGQIRACTPVHVATNLMHEGDAADRTGDGTAVSFTLSAARGLDGFEFNASCPTTWTLSLAEDGAPLPRERIHVGGAGATPPGSTFAVPSCSASDDGFSAARPGSSTAPGLLALAAADAGWQPLSLPLQPVPVYASTAPTPTSVAPARSAATTLGSVLLVTLEVLLGVLVVGAGLYLRRHRRRPV